MKMGTARSAFPFGKSTAMALIPRRVKPTTYCFIDAALPDAPCPRTTRIFSIVSVFFGREEVAMVRHHENFALPRQKYFVRTIDVSVCIHVSQQLYGDATRGCHHRGDGPDASQRVISYNRQRLGVLVSEASRRYPRGCRGGTCRRDR